MVLKILKITKIKIIIMPSRSYKKRRSKPKSRSKPRKTRTSRSPKKRTYKKRAKSASYKKRSYVRQPVYKLASERSPRSNVCKDTYGKDDCSNVMVGGLRACRYNWGRNKCEILPKEYRKSATLGVLESSRGAGATYNPYRFTGGKLDRSRLAPYEGNLITGTPRNNAYQAYRNRIMDI
jgi:hypothetical protein